ncbi:hypothetical protein QNI16_16965 [Cytophagaceae bacterium YF14B1]|uniref:Uncharacterized protein n=1 Tax=Xanthocytophaga flava TaxID=3048013 RepID=A0AAE3QT41_9BACT|nr:hypothetical protein [Xanthocytophaga flavus]MDJ1482198.1 hypothetical protein [Xanthocytophaga flavus]
MEIYFTISTVAEIICFLTGVICLYKDSETSWKLLCFYLLLVCSIEMTGMHMWKVLHKQNSLLYNFLLVFENLMVSYFFFYLFKAYKNRLNWLIIWLVTFSISFTSEMIYNHMNSFAFKTVIAMSVVFVIASLYFYYLILKDEQFRRLSHYAPFWWVNGVLFFYFGSTACNVLFDYVLTDTTNITGTIRYYIINILNIILYSCWSYAFLCRYRLRMSQHSS